VRIALDTNAYRALQDGDELLADEVRRAETIGMPIIVLGELRFGFLNGTRLHEDNKALERFLATPRVRILDVGEQTTWLFGEVATLLKRAGTPIQQDDMWIAALCKQHGYALATRDRGFKHVVGLDVFDYDSR
jgi:tRNA(fMet)-specific endonuclease VapC